MAAKKKGKGKGEHNPDACAQCKNGCRNCSCREAPKQGSRPPHQSVVDDSDGDEAYGPADRALAAPWG